MKFKAEPMIGYHHFQPRHIPIPPQPQVEINYRLEREIRKKEIAPKIEKPWVWEVPAFVFTEYPEPEPPQNIIYTPFGPIDLTPTPFPQSVEYYFERESRELQVMAQYLPAIAIASGLSSLIGKVRRLFG